MTGPYISLQRKNIALTTLITAVLANSAYALENADSQSNTVNIPATQDAPLVVMKINEQQLPAVSSTSAVSADDAFAFGNNATPKLNTADPLEPYNRFVFKMNTGLDNRIAKPVAKGYKRITPKPVRNGVGNFFSNLAEPWTAVNLLLQGKPVSSLKSLGRFTVNTVTTLGFGDPASTALDLNTTKEDFGQTLGVWGVPAGPYLVLPALGPSTLRDSGGRLVDITGNPLTYVDNTGVTATATTVNLTDKRARLMTFEGVVDSNNYELVRDVFLEKREFDVQESGDPSAQTAEPSFDEGFGD